MLGKNGKLLANSSQNAISRFFKRGINSSLSALSSGLLKVLDLRSARFRKSNGSLFNIVFLLYKP